MSLAQRINPRKFGFSPKLTAIVGAIIRHDYGVVDRKGGKLSGLSITSDGFVIAGSNVHDSGAFLGDYRDLEANLNLWKSELTSEDRAEFERLYKANVIDWRNV